MDEQLAHLSEKDRNLFMGSFTIRALRDSRYHNTAYAVAELIDNSSEADAGHIQLLCYERTVRGKHRRQMRIDELAVIDDGKGMDAETLLDALKFGGGTQHNSPRGIGKYGMGLPTSSMSQCKRVDVWTWQNGPESVLHSSIDADEIEAGNHLVPVPDKDTPVPDVWKQAADEKLLSHQKGTLVVWSKLDKIQWKRGKSLIENTIKEVGRIHRHYIHNEIVKIEGVWFDHPARIRSEQRKQFIANDPLYLMAPNSIKEEPWNKCAMFKEWANKDYSCMVDGKEETITVRYSIVKPEALKTPIATQNPGNTDRGRHARHNIGVSVVREDREIVLEDAFLREGGSAENPQNRWWGCEVFFKRACDELFGLDHNKQMVANFTQAAKTLARDDRATDVILDEEGIEKDEDVIYKIVGDIRDQTRAMMMEIRKMFAEKRGKASRESPGSPDKKAAKTATEADRDAIAAGEEQPTPTDKERDNKPPDERIEGLTQQFVDSGSTYDDAQELARLLVNEGLGYQFNSAQLDGYQMFNVRSTQGVLHVNLNMDHPVYDLLKHIEDNINGNTDEDHPAYIAGVAIRLLLSSWARMEDQTESREERRRIQDIANRWGRQVDKVISRLKERDE